MADVTVRMDFAGCDAIRNDPAVQAYLLGMAQDIADSATSMGCECTADVRPGRTRASARVKTVDDAAVRRNLRDNILEKAGDAGRR